jgi:hypothetical protein
MKERMKREIRIHDINLITDGSIHDRIPTITLLPQRRRNLP